MKKIKFIILSLLDAILCLNLQAKSTNSITYFGKSRQEGTEYVSMFHMKHWQNTTRSKVGNLINLRGLKLDNKFLNLFITRIKGIEQISGIDL